MKFSPTIILAVLLLGCTGKPVVLPAPHLPTPGPRPVSRVPEVPVPTSRSFDGSILKGTEFLLESGMSQAVQVRDPVLGLLGTDKDVQGTIEVFCNQVAEGTVENSGLLATRWSEYLQSWARKAKENGWEKGVVRTGVALPDEKGGLTVPIRIIQEKKEYTGWVYLEKSDGDLLVSDIQIVESVKATGPYDPDSPTQEISNPNRR